MDNAVSNNKGIDEIFAEIKALLPTTWPALTGPQKLHHLLKAVNEVLRPDGNWILVNGDLSLLELLSEAGETSRVRGTIS